MPEFWAIRAPGMENATRSFPDFGTVEAIHMSGGAFEINSIPTFNSSGLRPGSQALRLPRMAMPLVDGRSVLFMGSRTFSKDDIYTPLEEAYQDTTQSLQNPQINLQMMKNLPKIMKMMRRKKIMNQMKNLPKIMKMLRRKMIPNQMKKRKIPSQKGKISRNG